MHTYVRPFRLAGPTKLKHRPSEKSVCINIYRVVLGKITDGNFPCCRSVPVLRGISSYMGKPCTAEGGTVKKRNTAVSRQKSTVILRYRRKSTGRKQSTVYRPKNIVLFQNHRQSTVILQSKRPRQIRNTVYRRISTGT